MPFGEILPDPGSAPAGSSVALLRIPYVFSQDSLLNAKEFLEEAKIRGYELDRGHDLKSEDLQNLYQEKLLTPLFRISDTEIENRQLGVPGISEMNSRGRAFTAARAGSLIDSADEDYSTQWPYVKPQDVNDPHWRNPFLYSWWQLSDLKVALQNYSLIKLGHRRDDISGWTQRDRKRTRALIALSTLYLPGILGSMTMPLDGDEESIWTFKHKADLLELLQVADFDQLKLKREAIWLLGNARSRDPMKEWWPLLRNSNKAGWEKTAGITRDCIWQRIAAEILLRAHEELADKELIAPLDDLTGAQFVHPLHDRITPREKEAQPVARVLAEYGLSPHPRVLLLLEGKTEMIHIPALLNEWGLNQSNRVRVQNCRGADANPQLISRYAIAPQVGPILGGTFTLLPPTALFIAMDPEGRFWKTPQSRAKIKGDIQNAIREDVAAQGAVIVQEELDFLVNTFVWGEDSYEIANFTDEELVVDVTQLAGEQSGELTSPPTWETELRAALAQSRSKHRPLQKVIGPLGVSEDKPRLADILLPVLMSKCERELAEGTITTPVIQLVQDVRQLHALMSAGIYALQTKPAEI